MARNHKMAMMDGKDAGRFLTATIGSFIQDRLIDSASRSLHKDQCAERLAASAASTSPISSSATFQYSDQAVLANLDWGIDALEEAISTSHSETKLARLDHAEKMLKVCAMLDPEHTTAGVPNSYLSAWAHLHLAYLYRLRNDSSTSTLHAIEMFLVDPFFARIDFAPKLWEALFLPHMGSIVGWYTEARHRAVVEAAPDSTDLSFTADLDRFFDESLIASVRPDQAERLRELERLYGESLDENTRIYAKYYKDCLSTDGSGGKKGLVPMLPPIVEPPMTPLHEVSRSIPDYVKFGPILPKSAGFAGINGRVSANSNSGQRLEESEKQLLRDALIEEDEDVHMDSEIIALTGGPSEDEHYMASGSKLLASKMKSRPFSPNVLSPMDSPSTPSPKTLSPRPSFNRECGRLSNPTKSTSLPVTPRVRMDPSISSPDSDCETEPQRSRCKDFGYARSQSFGKFKSQLSESSFHNESEEEASPSRISLPTSEKLTLRTRPPKDFVCPITGQLFIDPVTLETGQTYERRAIHEWLKRGNTTCPITRQPLSSTVLPKTNYVLKRLITSWREQYPDLAQDFSYSETPRTSVSPISSRGLPFQPTLDNKDEVVKGDRIKRFTRPAVSTSPTSVISQAAAEAIIDGLKPYTSCLCTSEDLQECEAAVLNIARVWKDSKDGPGIHTYLAKPTNVNGLVEILSASINRDVLRASVYIISDLIYADESVAETLTSVDSDLDCLAALLKNGLSEAAVLIYQMKLTYAQLSGHELVPSLVQVIINKGEELDDFRLVIEPKDCAIALLEVMLLGGDERSRSLNALSVVAANGVPALIKCLDRTDGRLSVVSILICCMRADRGCRNLVAKKAELVLVLDLFQAGDESTRGVCIEFISQLISLNRRAICNQILHIIKDEGSFSTMHTFLVYLQMAPMEQQPAIANLLLQLDLLVEPRKMSIYREEAIEALIEALRKKEFPVSQMMALEVLASLSGHLTAEGKPSIEAWLLKTAGLDQSYNAMMKEDRMQSTENESIETMEEEQKAARDWEKRVSFILCNHDNGSIFKALEECLKSNSLGVAKSCLVVVTWLVYMLTILPDTGVRVAACQSLLNQFMNVLQSSKNLEERVLAALALKGFISDPDALQGMGLYAKSICKSLRKLKRCSAVAADILKALMSLPSVNTTEFWSCTEMAEVDVSVNGEVLALAYHEGRIFSCHSDGTIKIWEAGKKGMKLIQEVQEHSKAVTCLYISSSSDKLYSGSLDKTIRVWVLRSGEIHCIQVHDMKEAVHTLVANTKFACYTSQGTGAKVYNWDGASKHITFSKHVKCLAMTEKHLYCGCTAYTIQEADLSKYTSTSFFSGTRKLLGKQTIHALCIHKGLLYAGGSSVDAIAGKVFSLSTKATIGSLSTGFDIHCIAVNSEFVFTGTKCGIIEVWLRERLARVTPIKTSGGGNTKVNSLVLDSDKEMLFAGCSDGKIQVWALD